MWGNPRVEWPLHGVVSTSAASAFVHGSGYVPRVLVPVVLVREKTSHPARSSWVVVRGGGTCRRTLWKDNRRRHSERIPTLDITHKYGADYKLIFVGDATMSPYEIVYAGGSVEHWNEEPGAVWIKRLLNIYDKAIWLNPEPRERWDFTPSIKLTRELMNERMYPLTIAGLDEGIRALH